MSSSGVNRSKVANPLAVTGPNTTATFDVDTPSAGYVRWLAGATAIISWLGNLMTLNGNVQSDSNGTRNLGMPNFRFRNLWCNGLVVAYTAQSGASYIVNVDDTLIIINNAAATVTLPDPVFAPTGREYTVKNINAASATVVSAGVTKTIDGAASVTLTQWQRIQVVSDGTQWFVMSS